MLYKLKLSNGTIILNKCIAFDHWVSIYADNEIKAKIKSLHKFAYQLKTKEPVFIYNNINIKDIRRYIDIEDITNETK